MFKEYPNVTIALQFNQKRKALTASQQAAYDLANAAANKIKEDASNEEANAAASGSKPKGGEGIADL
jgi:hypothetical protein